MTRYQSYVITPRYAEASIIVNIPGYTRDINRDCLSQSWGDPARFESFAFAADVTALSGNARAVGIAGGQCDHRENQGPSPFSLGETLTPIPSKPVKSIYSLDFADMAEFLPNNVELMRREEDTARRGPSSCSRRQLKRMGDLLTRVQCYSTYAATLTEKQRQSIRELLGYLRLIVSKSQKIDGKGWRYYDTTFRK